METLFCVCSGLIKISILLFYRRLSSRAISRTFRWATWISIYFIAAYSIAFAIVPIFICTPISAFWDQVDFIKLAQGYEYKCLDEGTDIFVAAIVSTAQDLLTAMLPTILYWNLQIPLRQKMALFGIFGIGYGVVAIGALRAYASWRNFFDTYDVTWEANDMFLCKSARGARKYLAVSQKMLGHTDAPPLHDYALMRCLILDSLLELHIGAMVGVAVIHVVRNTLLIKTLTC